jgi:hypothetical protein
MPIWSGGTATGAAFFDEILEGAVLGGEAVDWARVVLASGAADAA